MLIYFYWSIIGVTINIRATEIKNYIHSQTYIHSHKMSQDFKHDVLRSQGIQLKRSRDISLEATLSIYEKEKLLGVSTCLSFARHKIY